MDERLTRLLEQHSVFLRREAIELGYDDKQLSRWLRSGITYRVRQGAYCLASTWKDADLDTRRLITADAVIRQAKVDGVLSHGSALATYGAPGTEQLDDHVHVTRCDARSGRKQAGVNQHRGWFGVNDVTYREGRWVTSGTRTALDIMAQLDVLHALIVVDAMLYAGHTTLEHLHHRYATMRTWPNMLRAELVLFLADGASESPGETWVRYLCWRGQLPKPILQYEVHDLGRLIARLDLAWPWLGVWVEFDGLVKYRAPYNPGLTAEEVVIREKRREDAVRRITGWTCVRFTWSDLQNPRQVLRQIRQAMEHRAA